MSLEKHTEQIQHPDTITKIFDVYLSANIKYYLIDSEKNTKNLDLEAYFTFFDPNNFILTIKNKQFFGYLKKIDFYESEIIIERMSNEDGEKTEMNFKGKGMSGDMTWTYQVDVPGLIKGAFSSRFQ
eukprot:gene12083-5576_t